MTPPFTSEPPPPTPLTPAASAMLRSLLDDDRARRLWQLEQTWQLGQDLNAARGEIAQVKGVTIRHDVEIRGLTARVEGCERKHDRFASKTGEHQMAEIRAELAKHEESKKHWGRYAIAALVGLALTVLGGIGSGCAIHYFF